MEMLLKMTMAQVYVSLYDFYTPRKLCLWWVYCFHVVRACVCVCVCASVRAAVRPYRFVSLITRIVIGGFSSNLANMLIYARQIL